MTTIRAAVWELDPGAEIELFDLDLSRFNAPIPHICFHAGANGLGSDVVWQGITYQRYPVQASGFQWNAQGTQPRPHIAVSNISGIMSALCRDYRDMVGAPVIRRRTLARYLDAVNFPNGNPSADPTASFADDVFYINQKTRESTDVIEFELAVPFDVQGAQLPRRQVITNCCPWAYRGDGCGYAGPPVATINDVPTSDPAQDACGKRLQSCRMRFGTGWSPYGGFPGAGQYR
jgi:lambda family phage minor tail protein L